MSDELALKNLIKKEKINYNKDGGNNDEGEQIDSHSVKVKNPNPDPVAYIISMQDISDKAILKGALINPTNISSTL